MIRHAYGNEPMSSAMCFECHDSRCGRPFTSSTSENVDIIRQFEEHRRSINDIAGFVDVTYRNVEAVLTSDVNIHRIAGKFVSRHPIRRNSVPKYIKISIMDDPTFMSRVITGDETFVRGYDPESKQQSLQWTPRPRMSSQSAARARECSQLTFAGVFSMDSSPLSAISNTIL